MKQEITSTEAVRNFGDCLARIKYKGDTFVITRNNKPVAELSPVRHLPMGTLRELLQMWKPDPDDPTFVADLQRANSTDLPEPNRWDS